MRHAPPPPVDPAAERRSQILDAAERCFVAHGFHRTTMQDVADAARMSVGNLYRYFPAKDAIVLGLAERDRADAALTLMRDGDEPWPALLRLIRSHLVDAPREKAVLLLEIWAEGTRNPTIAAMVERFQAENTMWISEALKGVSTLSDAAISEVVDRVRIETQGIVIDRALMAGYDPAPAVERLIVDLERRLWANVSEPRIVECVR